MEIRIRESGQVMYESEFRSLHSNSSLPPLTKEVLNDLGADVVFEGAQAQPTVYQIAYRNGVEQIGDKWFTKYSVSDLDADGITAKDAEIAINTRNSLKEQRTKNVEAIKVTTTAGNTFDGDEISQGRMARAILGLQAANVATVTWVLSNNTPIQVTASELGEALALAGAAQAAIWVI